jgi:hypothetical protein
VLPILAIFRSRKPWLLGIHCFSGFLGRRQVFQATFKKYTLFGEFYFNEAYNDLMFQAKRGEEIPLSFYEGKFREKDKVVLPSLIFIFSPAPGFR